MWWRLTRGVTPNFARCHPKFCEVSPQILRILRGVTQKKMRGVTPKKLRGVTPKKLRGVTPKKLRGVTPKKLRGVTPKKCEVSSQKIWGVILKNARSHPKKCEESPQPLRGVTMKVEGWPLTIFFLNNSISDVIKQRIATHCAWRSYGTVPTLKNWRFYLLLFLC